MRRWLFNILAGFSAVLVIAAVVLWPRSHWVTDYLHLAAAADRVVGFTSSRGVILFYRDRCHGKPIFGGPFGFGHYTARPAIKLGDPSKQTKLKGITAHVSFAGFLFESGRDNDEVSRLRICLPWWSVLLICAVLPTRWCVVARRRFRANQRQRNHLCTNCGYDLRASPDRCPECGTQAKPQPAKGAAA